MHCLFKSFNHVFKTRCSLDACFVALIDSPSMLLLVDFAKTMCEGLKTTFVIRSFEVSLMQANKVIR